MLKWHRYLSFFAVFFLPVISLSVQAAQHAVILQYHHVSNDTPESTSVTPEIFTQHLEYLERNNFNILPLTEVTHALQNSQPLPEKAIAITFDDAYRNIYENAFPLLKQKGWPFTIFVSTTPVDKGFGNFLTWSQLREMSQQGATIANHTLHHDHLVERKPGETKRQWLNRVKLDIITTESRIKDETGQNVKHFAWPFGEATPELRAMVKELGYVGLGQQSGAVGPLSDFTLLPRYPMAAGYAKMSSFKLKVNSLPLPVVSKTPDAMLINEQNLQPELTVSLQKGPYQKNQLRCYSGAQGELTVVWLDDNNTRFSTAANTPLAVGRSRYNCTAPSNSGQQYYWFSQPWLRLNAEGKALD